MQPPPTACMLYHTHYRYSDTSANEDDSFRNHIRQPKRVHFSSWNGHTIHVCCFMLAHASTKTFISQIHICQPSPKNSEKNLHQLKNSFAGSLVNRGITVHGLQPVKQEPEKTYASGKHETNKEFCFCANEYCRIDCNECFVAIS